MANPVLTPQVIAALMAGPAGAPPPGITPNPNHPRGFREESYGLLALAWAIMTGAVAMRLFTRWYLAKTYLIEDFLMLAAWAFFITEGTMLIMCTRYGIGVHMWDITLGSFLHAVEWANLAAIIYCVCVTLIKVAILIQFLRVFAPNRRTNAVMFFACWAWIVATIIFYTLDLILGAAACTTFERSWNPFAPGHCIVSTVNIFLAAAWFNVISDVLILLLPLPAIYKLHMRPKKKLAIAVLFTAGAAFVKHDPDVVEHLLIGHRACVASIVRLYYTYALKTATDASWHYAPLGLLTSYELAAAGLVFCLPVAPRFFQFVKDKAYSTFPSRSGSPSLEAKSREPERLTWANQVFGKPRSGIQPESLGVSSIGHYLGPQRSASGLTHDIPLSSTDGGNCSTDRLSVSAKTDQV